MLIFRDKADVKIEYPIEDIGDKSRILYFDIETTGFSRKYCSIYLIGCMYFVGDTPMYIQWFAENYNDEANVLMAFYKFIENYDTLIHFNGNAFDIPFVKERGLKYRLNFDFDRFNSIDIYKPMSKLVKILNLENLKQKTFERYIGIQRSDPFTGGDLVEVYKQYVVSKDEKLLFPLLLHNCEDVWNMGMLTSLLSIADLFNGKFEIKSHSFNNFSDSNGDEQTELSVNLSLINTLPVPLSITHESLCLKADKNKALMTVKVMPMTLKLFFKNYKDYYYLPEEDRAIHKSIATFVSPSFRKKATASTCYEKHSDKYLPLFDITLDDFSYIFKEDYKSKAAYIRCSDINENNINSYVLSILTKMKDIKL